MLTRQKTTQFSAKSVRANGDTPSSGMFSPDHYRAVRRNLREAERLPGWCYTEQTFYDREVDNIFKKNWIFAGREEQISSPGDYLTIELFGEGIIIVRSDDGSISAFVNSCRHAGTRLLKGTGHCADIRCPFHGWTYSLTGQLLGAPRTREVLAFDKSSNGLWPVRIGRFGGFIFVNLSPDAPSLESHLGNLPEVFASYDLGNMICVRRSEYEVASNWKLYVSVDMESYHAPYVHPRSIGKQAISRQAVSGNWETIYMESSRTIAMTRDDQCPGFPHIKGLAGKAAAGTYFSMIYPSLLLITTLDSMWWIHKLPKTVDRTSVHAGFCFPRETVARADFDDIASHYHRRWDQVMEEDNRIVEEQQAGVRSPSYRPGRYADPEGACHAVDNWILDQILDHQELGRR
jgi:phenylpropionate dioxygenase-like ring-hydroxylating dioxygenase large terminal subunit